ELRADRRRRREDRVQRFEEQVGGAAKLEAAAGKGRADERDRQRAQRGAPLRGAGKGGRVPYAALSLPCRSHTTTLTSREGTMTILRGVRPSPWRANASVASAAARIASSSAEAATRTEPRTLPLICSTSSIVSCSSARSSTCGHGASSRSPSARAKPSSLHSACPMCGTIG